MRERKKTKMAIENDTSKITKQQQDAFDVLAKVYESVKSRRKAMIIVNIIEENSEHVTSDGFVMLNRISGDGSVMGMGIIVADFVSSLSRDTGSYESEIWQIVLDYLQIISQHGQPKPSDLDN